jgi:hypothetical protein
MDPKKIKFLCQILEESRNEVLMETDIQDFLMSAYKKYYNYLHELNYNLDPIQRKILKDKDFENINKEVVTSLIQWLQKTKENTIFLELSFDPFENMNEFNNAVDLQYNEYELTGQLNNDIILDSPYSRERNSTFSKSYDPLFERSVSMESPKEDEVNELSNLIKEVKTLHMQYKEKAEKSLFKPNAKRLKTIENVESIMQKIQQDSTLDNQYRTFLIIGLLQLNKDSVLQHQNEHDFLARAGLRDLFRKTNSRLVSSYDEILNKFNQSHSNPFSTIEPYNSNKCADLFKQHAKNYFNDIELEYENIPKKN